MSSFTASINLAVYLMPIFMALCIAAPIIIMGYILADVPCSQVLQTFAKLGRGFASKEGIVDKVIALFHNNEKDGAKAEEREKLIQTVNIWCLRLGKSTSYDDIMRQGNQVTVIGVLALIVFAFLGIAMQSVIFFFLGIIMCIFGVFYPQIQISSLKGEIKKLNKSLLFELPILASVFAQILPTGKSVDTIFEDYLPQAGAFRRDIELTLADLKNKTKYAALANMSSRIQTGERLDEMGQFIDMIKSSANVTATSQNLQGLSDRVHQTYVQPFIEGKRNSKMMVLEVCIVVVVVLVIFLYVSPTFIQLVNSMSELN